jgi:hypothetical protein
VLVTGCEQQGLRAEPPKACCTGSCCLLLFAPAFAAQAFSMLTWERGCHTACLERCSLRNAPGSLAVHYCWGPSLRPVMAAVQL